MKAPSRSTVTISWLLSLLAALILALSASLKLAGGPALAEAFAHFDWPVSKAVPLGILEIGCLVVYFIPRTAVLGAILLTGYMGGAVATHIRISELFVVQVLLGVMFWLGLYLREPRLHALIPLRRGVQQPGEALS